ncbi:MAG: aminotransferase class I/II-fold pyridoxal phosphate-dependent enzyme [Fibromonadaceae bacterium]|jgi:aspartate/methionine/tyrosine aminotransferase|nr:aminotransferase class I/II-fold pyridoxal phosphate-dependent enzyme [Fibromonadaceae bacterium]
MTQTSISELANTLNSNLGLESCIAYRAFSERGKRMYFPHKGILGQSAEAKSAEINATIGTAFEDDGTPLMLPVVQKSFTLPTTATHAAFLYQPSFGKAMLRKKWSEMMLKKNANLAGIKFSEPVITSALTHALSVSASLFVNSGDTLIIPDLYWDNYDLIFTESHGAKIKTFNTFVKGNFDVAALAKSLETGTDKKIVLLNFPNNPTGYTVKENEAKEICKVLTDCAEKGNDVVVLLDDAYFGLVYEDDVYKESLFGLLANAHKNLLAIKLDGPTKEDYVWGFRVGFITFGFKGATDIQLKALEDKAAGTVRATISNVASISQEVLLNAYNCENYESEKQEKYDTIKIRYEKIKEILAGHEEYGESFSAMPFNSGYFMCVKVNGADPEAVRKECLKNHWLGVIVLSGLIRIAFSSVALDKIEELFERLHRAVKAVKQQH